ncbi:MAG: tRNA (adenosine(37)-N6)-threonylcarbamoyltransferase complex ATPase subunit type 1 TsaE [Paludibacteraceae bacterium]|nr:tRNA (adenosine(37)-N6)-threonylcarbamoyltransferase complex ATPase subunit type 1 TsaE [Paludibacteraceae bacterium]
MNTYTIKKEENGQLYLMTEEGEQIQASELLKLYPDKKVYALEARMGAGKTTLVKQLMNELGTEDIVNSPTFAIVNVYERFIDKNHTSKEEVYHFDCYRLKDIREALDFGAEEYLYSGNYCFIEWPDIIAPILPEDTIWIEIEVTDQGKRILTIK